MLEQSVRDSIPNPVIVFDDIPPEFTREDAPIFLHYRQPSFTHLGMTPTPKGYQSLSDFHTHSLRRGIEHSLRVTSASVDRIYWNNWRTGQCQDVTRIDPKNEIVWREWSDRNSK
jgi:hypothetical protein